MRTDEERSFTTDDFNFPIVNIPFKCSNIPVTPCIWSIFLWLIWNSKSCGSYSDFLDRGFAANSELSYWTKGSSLLRWSILLWKFHVATMTWFIVREYDHEYVPFVVSTIRSFSHSWLITKFVTRVTRRVSLVERELFSLPEYPPFLVWFVLLNL